MDINRSNYSEIRWAAKIIVVFVIDSLARGRNSNTGFEICEAVQDFRDEGNEVLEPIGSSVQHNDGDVKGRQVLLKRQIAVAR